MADDDKNDSFPPEDEEEEVKTSVETIDAKRAEAERVKAESIPPAAKDGEGEAEASGAKDEADSGDDDSGSDVDAADGDDNSGSDADAADTADAASAEEDGAKAPTPQEMPAAAKPKQGDAYRESGAHQEEHHGFAHVTSLKLLVTVLTVLLILTVATVAVTSIDLGSQWNLVAAMVIATVKAGLVVTFFMHLLWDKKFHLLIFLSSVLFLILFLGLAVTDHREYQDDIDAKEADLKAAAAATD